MKQSTQVVKLFIGIISILILTTCSSKVTSPEENKSSSIIPLKLGNTWEYYVTYFDSVGIMYEAKHVSQFVNGKINILDLTWYCYNSYKNYWYTNKSDGYWLYYKSTNGAEDQSMLIYKYPTIVGEKYADIDVISVDEEIQVPAGKFKCIHLLQGSDSPSDNSDYSSEIYLCPKIGLIRSVQMKRKSNGEKFIMAKCELTNYTLN